MLHRLHLYFKEQFPLMARLAVGAVIFFEMYFIVLLNAGVSDFRIGKEELIGAWTVFGFLMFLRIADDFKDYETDKVLFPHRTLPSGQVYKKDLWVVLLSVTAITIVLNLVFMPNLYFFLFLYFYGFLMSMWFFQKSKIQKSLPMALVTHNPVQMVMNIYVISFTVMKYNLNWNVPYVFLAAFTLYFPALIWEVGRKIRAPKDETDYTTYSKLFGVKRSIRFITILTWVDIFTNVLLVWNLNQVSALLLLAAAFWITWRFVRFVKNPEAFPIIREIERYTYVQETLMLVTVAVFLVVGRIGL